MATQKNFTINHFNLIAITLIAIVVIVSYLDSMTRPILFLDESAYLARGVAIVEEGKIPTLPTSPGVSLIHAFNYWFWRNDPLGMDIAGKFSAFIGKIILHIALYAAITKSLNQRWFSTSIIIFANLRARLQLIRSVFRGISVAHLASFNYHEFKQKPFLILTLSSIVATSSLMRNDGFILFIGLTPIVAFYLRNQLSAIQFLSKMVIYWFLPFIFITGSMVALSWLTTGEFSPLPIARTYTAFEQGHGIVRRFELERQLKNPWVEGKKIASERYGSLEDNQGNVFIAISKNPLSWQEHIAYNFRDFFLRWHEAHNGHISLVSLFLCWFGWISLFIHRKKFLAISIATLFLPFTFFF
jgi:hypothetical protein